jgi:excinuclease ABC subunit A
MDTIHIRGARTHNLKNVDLDIPRDQLVVITGLSGSGKSSLAFDTLYAEGQRRYVESLSAYARQFLQLMEKPDVDLIEGLSPAIAIEQKAGSHNPRSTVGTVTEINDYLRLLYARAGTPHCPQHPDQVLAAQTVAQMVDAVQALQAGLRVLILAPLGAIPASGGVLQARLSELRGQGFARVRLQPVGTTSAQTDTPTPAAGAQIVELDDLQSVQAGPGDHTVEVVIDRIRTPVAARQRLADSFETALRLTDGRARIAVLDDGSEQVFCSRYACPVCGHALSELEPRLFSFNNPAGACPDCDGLGQMPFIDARRVVEFPELSLASGAIRGWDRRNPFCYQLLNDLARALAFDLDTPFAQLDEPVRELILFGSGTQRFSFTYAAETGRSVRREHSFEGVVPNLQRRLRETDSPQVREELSRYQSMHACPSCGGSRLRAEARLVTVGQTDEPYPIHQVNGWTLARALSWFEQLELPGSRGPVAARIVREIVNRLRFLNDVGLGYLSLDRPAETLSGGEAQRIRLASQIGSGLTGVMYVLDEPSIGLHQRDNDRLIATLKRLRDLGNSVLVVEHDEDAIRAADHVIDMGPGAGDLGGRVIAQGKPAAIAASDESITGQYLSRRLSIAVPDQRSRPDGRWLSVRGARAHNLKNISVDIPVGLLTCITGVSGSGKSTLINETVHPAVARRVNRGGPEPAACDAVEGAEHFDKVIAVDQSPIGRTPRSNPATYTGVFTAIRELFAETPSARERGYGTGRFSFNVKGGRCEACEGDGLIRVEMHFLPDVYVPCDTCRGLRYNRETLEISYRGLNIAEVLSLTVTQAHQFFSAVPTIGRKLATLIEVGLGYVRLGQSATTLSGGEAQRVKLAEELSRRDTGRTLYILDEPTTGLHFHDVAMLLKVLRALRERGNTVLIIEHNLDVIKTADWVIDLGPEGGEAGGHLVASGTPEDLLAVSSSHTGRYLAPLLSKPARRRAA